MFRYKNFHFDFDCDSWIFLVIRKHNFVFVFIMCSGTHTNTYVFVFAVMFVFMACSGTHSFCVCVLSWFRQDVSYIPEHHGWTLFRPVLGDRTRQGAHVRGRGRAHTSLCCAANTSTPHSICTFQLFSEQQTWGRFSFQCALHSCWWLPTQKLTLDAPVTTAAVSQRCYVCHI